MKLSTCFLDGPAEGVRLSLARAPYFLRVVRSRVGKWDALDLVEDKPKPTESITVYYRVSEPYTAFVDYRTPGGQKRGQRTVSADYRVFPDQPPDMAIRDNEAWQAWCKLTAHALNAEAGGDA